MRLYWNRVDHEPNVTGVLIRKGEERQRHRGEGHVTREAETGVMRLQASDWEQHHRLRECGTDLSPWPSERAWPCLHIDLIIL